LSLDEIRESIEDAIGRTLPGGPGVRHFALFRFERMLKGIPQLAYRPAEDLEPFVREWWQRSVHRVREKRWGETWRDFCSGWSRVRLPAGSSLEAVRELLEQRLPVDDWATDEDRHEQQIFRLEIACETLSELWGGGVFPLSQEVAADLLGVGRTTAGKLLRHLEKVGIIARVGEHDRLKRLARRWTYHGPVAVELAARFAPPPR
jgi:hypothetical protein